MPYYANALCRLGHGAQVSPAQRAQGRDGRINGLHAPIFGADDRVREHLMDHTTDVKDAIPIGNGCISIGADSRSRLVLRHLDHVSVIVQNGVCLILRYLGDLVHRHVKQPPRREEADLVLPCIELLRRQLRQEINRAEERVGRGEMKIAMLIDGRSHNVTFM